MKKTILIIGAGPLVGFAVAERFGREGYQVALMARNRNNLEKLAASLENKGISTAIFVADVMDQQSLKEAISAVVTQFGNIDVLEFSPVPPMDSMRLPRNIDTANAQFHIDFQLMSVITVVQAVLPGMLHRKQGTLLFTTSASAQRPVLVTATYGIAAGALLNYTRLLNRDLAKDNIYAGIVSIGALVYQNERPDPELIKLFPEGMPTIAAKEVADIHWQMHQNKTEHEMVVGDMDAYGSVLGG